MFGFAEWPWLAIGIVESIEIIVPALMPSTLELL